jgi:nitroimidazol reductase NimA-like FMN-containing flavoprotein (pyridoxamine 5'-phosphate oxidase superfamily)
VKLDKYHLRRKEKTIRDEKQLEEILAATRYVTIAMAVADEPYLVNLTHGYDPGKRCLYFHCAGKGRKIDMLKKNPHVWGQALMDQGYVDGKCDHAFRSVMFGGTVSFIEEIAEKRHGLEVMIRQQESDPETVMAWHMKPDEVRGVTMGRIDVEGISGKSWQKE